MNKHILIIAAVFLMGLTSCKKEGGNTGIIVKETKTENVSYKETTYRYVAEDGSNALVTFINSNDGNYISVTSNKKTIKIKQKEESVYEENGVVIKSEGDSITITQNDNVIGLKKARGQ